MEKYGFVYLWYDKKHKRFYIGSHWGTEDDGYICSSTWMKNSYKRRPTDFKRRILKKTNDRSKLFEIEQFYLSMIKDEEIKIRYYNLTNKIRGNWSHNEEKRLSVGQKISLSQIGRVHSEETKKKMSEVRKKLMNDDIKRKVSEFHTGKKRSAETRKKMSESQQKMSEETKKKISESRKKYWQMKKEK